MENDGVLVTILLVVGLVCLAGMYQFGKWQERKAYTKAFIREVEAAYWEGYGERARQDMLGASK